LENNYFAVVYLLLLSPSTDAEVSYCKEFCMGPFSTIKDLMSLICDHPHDIMMSWNNYLSNMLTRLNALNSKNDDHGNYQEDNDSDDNDTVTVNI
jgi:hypothetical protein